VGLVHYTHATAAKSFEDAVMGDGLADEGVGLRHSAAILGCDLRQVNKLAQSAGPEQMRWLTRLHLFMA